MTLPIDRQRLANRACAAAFFFFYGLLRTLPPSRFRTIAAPFVRAFIRVAIPKRRVIKNLSAAFGQSYSRATKEGLARGVREHFFRNLFDCLLQLTDDRHALEVADIHGQENLDSALAKGKGVIVLGAHIGKFCFVGDAPRP